MKRAATKDADQRTGKTMRMTRMKRVIDEIEYSHSKRVRRQPSELENARRTVRFQAEEIVQLRQRLQQQAQTATHMSKHIKKLNADLLSGGQVVRGLLTRIEELEADRASHSYSAEYFGKNYIIE